MQIWVVVVCLEVGVLIVCNGVLLCCAFGQAAPLIVCMKMLLSVICISCVSLHSSAVLVV